MSRSAFTLKTLASASDIGILHNGNYHDHSGIQASLMAFMRKHPNEIAEMSAVLQQQYQYDEVLARIDQELRQLKAKDPFTLTPEDQTRGRQLQTQKTELQAKKNADPMRHAYERMFGSDGQWYEPW